MAEILYTNPEISRNQEKFDRNQTANQVETLKCVLLVTGGSCAQRRG